jgi:hypothetical protein
MSRFIHGAGTNTNWGLWWTNQNELITCGEMTSSSTLINFGENAVGGLIPNDAILRRTNTAPSGYLAKYNRFGQLVWARSTDNMTYYSVTATSNGDIYATARLGSTGTSFNMIENGIGGDLTTGLTGTKTAGFGDGGMIMKYNSNGRPLWTRMIDGTDSDVIDNIWSDASGNIYTVVNIASSTVTLTNNAIGGTAGPTFTINGIGAWTFKYNSDGTPIWARKMHSNNTTTHFKLHVTAGGDVYVTGHTSSTNSINFATDAAGGTTSFTFSATKPGSSNGPYILKYNANGVPQWIRWISGTGDDHGRNVTTDNLGNVYGVGRLGSATTTVNLGTNAVGGVIPTAIITKPNTGFNGCFLIKYTSEGAYLWTRFVDGAGDDIGLAVACDNARNVYYSGLITENSTSINLAQNANGGNTFYNFILTKPTSAGDGNFFIKYGPEGNVLWGRIVDSLATSSFDRIYNIVPAQSNGHI